MKTDVALHTGQQTYISLYTGGGGLDLGFRLANPDAVPLLYVERELPAAALVVDHIEAGLLDAAPVWADTGTLDCKPFADKVDWIIGGFPCQPFSVAGKQRGTEDQRWLWEHIRRLAVEIRPRYLFLENTPGLLVHSGIGTILGDLSEIGFDAEWTSVRASDVGAPHRRERVFLLAYSDSSRSTSNTGDNGEERSVSEEERQPEYSATVSGRGSSDVAHSDNRLGNGQIEEVRAGRSPSVDDSNHMAYSTRDGEQGPHRQAGRGRGGRVRLSSKQLAHTGHDARRSEQEQQHTLETTGVGQSSTEHDVGDTNDEGLQGRQQPVGQRAHELPAWPPGPSDTDAWAAVLRERPDLAPAIESEVRGMDDGLARGMDLSRTDKLRILGNGVVPQQAALAFTILAERLAE